ncbi:uncharacterized protein LOC103507372, partial [Diaphorina citri]|uniref:Uncharacterized protein LOC103507372 n=1 Tax=Diaphorina citri TaxID=121845 RepID=A0A3Q0IP12_DIACI
MRTPAAGNASYVILGTSSSYLRRLSPEINLERAPLIHILAALIIATVTLALNQLKVAPIDFFHFTDSFDQTNTFFSGAHPRRPTLPIIPPPDNTSDAEENLLIRESNPGDSKTNCNTLDSIGTKVAPIDFFHFTDSFDQTNTFFSGAHPRRPTLPTIPPPDNTSDAEENLLIRESNPGDSKTNCNTLDSIGSEQTVGSWVGKTYYNTQNERIEPVTCDITSTISLSDSILGGGDHSYTIGQDTLERIVSIEGERRFDPEGTTESTLQNAPTPGPLPLTPMPLPSTSAKPLVFQLGKPSAESTPNTASNVATGSEGFARKSEGYNSNSANVATEGFTRKGEGYHNSANLASEGFKGEGGSKMDFPEVSTKKPQGFNASKEGFTRKTEGGSKSPNLAGEGPSRRTEGFKMDAAGDSHETTLVSSSDNDPITEYEIKQKKHRSERVGRMIGEPLTTSDRSSDRRSPNEERNKEGTDKRGHKEETDERNSKDKRSYGKEDSLNKRRASIYGQEDKGESEKRIYADDNADKRGHKEEKRMAKEEVQDKRRHKHRYSHEKQSYNEKGKYDEKPSYNEEEGDVNEDTGHMSQVAKNAGEDERRDSRSDARKSRSSLDIERQVKRAEKDGYREGRPDKENHREGRTDKDGHKDGRTEKDVYKERESYRQGKARTNKDIPKGKDKRSGEDGKSSAIGSQGEKDFEAREAERRHQEDLNQCRRNNEHIKQIVEKYNDSLRNPVTVQVQFQQEGPLHGEKLGDKNGPNSAHTNGRKTSLPEKTDRMSTSRNDHEDRKLLTRHEVQSGNSEPAENVRNFPTRREVHSGNSDDQEQAMRRSGKYKRGKYYP